MTAKRRFKSEAFEAIHSSASALLKAGAIDKATMREFDESCLSVPVSLEPVQIKQLRERHHVSQPVFARYLNTSESTVEKWETGAKRPSGMALKLLISTREETCSMLNIQTMPSRMRSIISGAHRSSGRSGQNHPVMGKAEDLGHTVLCHAIQHQMSRRLYPIRGIDCHTNQMSRK